jgi:ubiquinone/menaquinone biosynthesis C-methylase UbiE
MDTVRGYYDRVPETGRFENAMGRLEFERSKHIIARFLPSSPGQIADVGAGVGAYSFWLSRMGHRVSAVEPSPRQLRLLQERNEKEENKLARIVGSDASRLDLPDASFDAVLCMGPLYHLTSPELRRTVLKEAQRILRPGAFLVTAYISRFASLMDGYFRGFIEDAEFAHLVEADLREGAHHPPAHDRYFTEAYFHTVSEIGPELASAGLRMTHLLAVESVFWQLPSLDRFLQDPLHSERLFRFIEAVESDVTLMGASAHFLAISRASERERQKWNER